MMNRFAVFLRGVNVAGKGMIKMEMLQRTLAGFGFANIKTYINSGNLILSTDKSLQDTRVEIKDIIRQKFNVETEIFVKTLPELQTILSDDPFDPEKENINSKRMVILLSEIPDSEKISLLMHDPLVMEKIYHTGDVLYVYYPDGSGTSRFNVIYIEKHLKLKATARNWSTMVKITEMLS